mgnify:CR=1 FL=1
MAIGSSTGGVEALDNILPQFPENSPPIVIAQHMPAIFTSSFANRLSQHCHIKIVEAVEGALIEEGHAYICPGGKNMEIKKIGPHLNISLIAMTKPPAKSVINIVLKNLDNFIINLQVKD